MVDNIKGAFLNQFFKKGHTKLGLYYEMGAGSTMKLEMQEDKLGYKTVKEWAEVNEDTPPRMVKFFPVMLGRCDRVQLRISGTGNVRLRALTREIHKGSEV